MSRCRDASGALPVTASLDSQQRRRVRVRRLGATAHGVAPGAAEPPRDAEVPPGSRPDVLVLVVPAGDVSRPEVDTLSGLQGSADVIVAVVIAERNVAVDDWTRVVLGAVREIADVVVHVGDDGLMPDLLSTLGEVEP